MSDTFDVFNGVSGFSGFYKPNSDGIDTAIKFVRGNKAAVEKDANSFLKTASNIVLQNKENESLEGNIDDGFLAQSYQIQWGRGVTMQRVLNKNKPIAMVGVGSGQLSITGLLGTYEGFKALLGIGDKATTTEDLCNPLNAIIACGNGFIACSNEDNKQIEAKSAVGIILTNIIVASFNLTGQYDQNNILMQTGSVSFQIGGCKIQAIKA